MNFGTDFSEHLQVRLDHVVGKDIVAVGPHNPFAILDQRIRDFEGVISCCCKVIHMRPRCAERRVVIF